MVFTSIALHSSQWWYRLTQKHRKWYGFLVDSCVFCTTPHTIIFRGVPNTTAVPCYTMMMMMGFFFFFLHFQQTQVSRIDKAWDIRSVHCIAITIRQMIMFESRLRVYKCVVALKLFIYFWIWDAQIRHLHNLSYCAQVLFSLTMFYQYICATGLP